MANGLCAVELRGISKRYPGGRKQANNNITLDLRKGEILCIAGENGAGKTTLMKILCGIETQDAGEIFINGKKETIDSPLTANKLGIGMVHQHFMLFDEYTVAENIVMGIEPRKLGFFFDTQKARNAAEKIIASHNFPIDAGRRVKDLTLGEMQQVEICRILHRNAQIIIFDEPTSILTERETLSLFKTFKELVSAGKSLILITHKLREIAGNCDRVAVLRKGEIVGVCDASEIDEYNIARMMIEEEFNHEPTRTNTNYCKAIEAKVREVRGKNNSNPILQFENITVLRKGQKRPLLDKVSFSLHSGEILGFAGVGGNGLGVIEAVLGGFLHPAEGKVLHNGRDISALDTVSLRNRGLAYVPSDRLRVGSAKDAAIDENMIINRRSEFTRRGIIDKKAAADFSEELVKGYNIEAGQGTEITASLSGGNLQKLILAREINWLKDYIVFAEPSWGLDIASSRFIMEEIIKLKEKGAAVILISTNLDEIISLADRVMVMYRGRIAGEFANNGDASIKEKIGNCMQGLCSAYAEHRAAAE